MVLIKGEAEGTIAHLTINFLRLLIRHFRQLLSVFCLMHTQVVDKLINGEGWVVNGTMDKLIQNRLNRFTTSRTTLLTFRVAHRAKEEVSLHMQDLTRKRKN